MIDTILLVMASLVVLVVGCYGVYLAVRGYRPDDWEYAGLYCGLAPAFLFIGMLGLFCAGGCL
mgnify:CR=1 FL=1